jgi:hypothetical protein
MNDTMSPHDAERAAADALLAALPPGEAGHELFAAYEEATGESWFADMERVMEAVAAHRPRRAGVIRRTYEHVVTCDCYEPCKLDR